MKYTKTHDGHDGSRNSRLLFRRRIVPCASWLFVVFVGLRALSAQTPQPPPPPAAPQQPQKAPEQLETRADLVLVDVSVVDGNGSPVPDLKSTDFQLSVNGQSRPVHTVQFISTLGSKSTVETTPREEQYTSNDARSSGRLLLFAVDENHLRFGGAIGVLRTAERVMNTLAPGDLVGLAVLPFGTGGVEFTADRLRIKRALERVTGKQPARPIDVLRVHEAWAFENNNSLIWERVIERECGGDTGLMLEACRRQMEAEAKGVITDASGRGSQSIRALEELMARMSVYRSPVNVVFISEGLFIARDRNDLTNFARQAATARVTLHVVQPSGSMFDRDKPEVAGAGFGDEALLGEGLQFLAGETRGSYYNINTGTGATVFERLSRELSGYYLLSFEPTDNDRTSKNRRIKVEVARRGVTVRARSTYSLPESGAAALATGAPEEQVKQLLIAPLPSGGLPIRVSSFAIANAQDSRVRVIVSAELGEPARDAAEWPVGMLVVDKDSKFVVNTIASMKLTPSSERTESPRLLITSFVVDPGDYTLRLAAAAPDGRTGSVHHAIRATLLPLGGADNIHASDFIVSSEPKARNDAPRPTPTSIIDSETMTAGVDLTSTDLALLGKTRVTIEVAESETSAALLRTEATSVARAARSQRGFAAVMRLGLLPPGEYVARAIVNVPGKKDSLLTRAFKLAPAPPATTETAAPAPPDPDALALEDPPVPMPTQILVPLPRFVADDVLRPVVVSLFVDELQRRFNLSAETDAVLNLAKKGTFAAPPADAGTTAEDEPVLSFVRGLAAMQKNEMAQAAAWFQLSLRGASDFLGAAFYLGAVHAVNGRNRDAVGAWQMSLLSDSADVVYPVLVDGWLRAGDGQAALELIAEAPEVWPSDEARWRRVTIAQAMLGQFAPALETANQILAKRPDDLDMLFVAIQVLYRMHGGKPLAGDMRQQFVTYADRYIQKQGPQIALVETWRKAVLR